MKRLLITAVFVVLLLSCATLNQPAAIPIFDEIRNIAVKEGTLVGKEYYAMRKYEGEVVQISFERARNWVLIQRFDSKMVYSYAVGHFPGSGVGEYLEGLFFGEEMLDRRSISGTAATEQAKKLLDAYKKGRKLGVGEV